MLGREEARVESHRAFGAGAQDDRTGVADQAGGRDKAGGLYRPLKIAAIYARVSTERQEKEQTVDSQLDALQRAAREGGYEVAPSHVFVDERRSGAHLDRPGLDRLRDLASEGTFEAVLVSSPDRLARHYAYQVLVMEELQRTGCEVVFLNSTHSARRRRSGCSCRSRASSPSTSAPSSRRGPGAQDCSPPGRDG